MHLQLQFTIESGVEGRAEKGESQFDLQGYIMLC